MRACSGTWIAHGSGSADRETVDRHDRVAVPPGEAGLQLRRIWLSKEEEAGYYAGFANEGLWPLCHIAHVRPTFRTSRLGVLPEGQCALRRCRRGRIKTKDPVVLVQDYHFALLPRMIRDRLPNATIMTFWHIPWPNPEAFAICPWRHELLEGLLGSSILGFHTQFHCNNFLDTVDRQLEARVDREVIHNLLSRPVDRGSSLPDLDRVAACAAAHRRSPSPRRGSPFGSGCGYLPNHRLGVGIDRLDYTKGIIERFNAVARLLELEPRWLGRFTFVQIAAPTRATIDDYRDYAARVQRARRRDQRALPGREAPADRAARRTSRARRRLRVPPRRRPVLREQPARRHEPRGQGVRRRPRRRAGRADPVAVCRCLARTARGADRQSRTTPISAPRHFISR